MKCYQIFILTLVSLYFTISELSAQQIGGSIYEAIPLPKSKPIELHQFQVPQFYNVTPPVNNQANKKDLEIKIQKDQYNKLKLKHRSSNKDELVFHLKYLNVTDEDKNLTEWRPLNEPVYITISRTLIQLINTDAVDVFNINRIDSSDESITNFYSDAGEMIGFVVLKPGVYMFMLSNEDQAMAFIGSKI